MKMPTPNSTNDRLLRKMHELGPVTLIDLLVRADVLPRLKRDRADHMCVALDDLRAHGCIQVDGETFTLTQRARWHLDGTRPVATDPATPPTPPRVIDHMTTVLKPQYIVSPLGRREGSNDFRDVPSLHNRLMGTRT